MYKTFLLVVSFLSLLNSTHLEAATIPAKRVYWGRSGAINSIRPTGDSLRSITAFDYPNPHPYYVEIDSENGHIYWTDAADGVIRRAKLDGSQMDTIVDSVDRPHSLALDTVHSKMYWVNQPDRDVLRSNLDGTEVEVIYDGPFETDPRFIAVDPIREKVYWTDTRNSFVMQSNLDGSEIVTLIDVNRNALTGIAVDLLHEKLYWGSQGAIQRSNLDGSMVETAVQLYITASTFGLAVDPIGEHIYWVSSGFQNEIFRANYDGTSARQITSPVPGRATSAHNVALSYTFIPEPTTFALLSLGSLWLLRWR